MALLSREDLIARIKADPYRKGRDCQGCGLYADCFSPFMRGRKINPGPTRLIIVQEAPRYTADSEDNFMQGSAWAFLRGSLKAVGIDYKDIYFTHALACRPAENDQRAQLSHVKYCQRGLWLEIEDINPEVVVLLGNVGLKAVIGLDKITSRSGNPIKACDIQGYHLKEFPFTDPNPERLYFPLLAPSYVLNTRDTPSEEATVNQFSRDMQRLKRLLDGTLPLEQPIPPHRVITDFKEACKYLDDLHNYPRVGYDYETPDLDPYQDYSTVLCVAFAPQQRKVREDGSVVPEHGAEYPWTLPDAGVGIPLDHKDTPFTKKQIGILLKKVRSFLRNPTIRKVAWNHVFEYIVGSVVVEQEPQGKIEDPMYEVFSTNEFPGTHGLKYNTRIYTEFGGYEEENEKAFKGAAGNYGNIPGSILFPYNAMDAYGMMLCEQNFYHKVTSEQQWPLVEGILHPAVPFLARMEIQGIKVNRGKVVELTTDFDDRIVQIENELLAMPEVLKAEYKIREILSEKKQEAVKEKAFDEAKREFMKAKEAADKAPPENQIAFMEARVRKLRDHIKNNEKKGVKLPEARRLKDESVQKYRAMVKERKVLLKAAATTGKKAERKRQAYESVVDAIDTEKCFSLSKPDHVRILIYDILRLRIIKRTPTGLPSTDDDVIQAYSKKHRAIALLDAYRSLTKIRSTYLWPLHPDNPHTIVKPDGKIHPNVKALARTGRLMSGSKGRGKSEEASSKFKFNIQNLPKPIELYDGTVVTIRDIFITEHICDACYPTPKRGCPNCGRIVESDYKGLEAYTLGIIAQDAAVLECVQTQTELDPYTSELEMIGIKLDLGIPCPGWEERVAFLKEKIGIRADNADFHKRSASFLYGVPPEKVTKAQRDESKHVAGFGLLYGRQAAALAHDMGWTVEHGEMMVAKFWAGYPGIKARNDAEIAFARRHGYVTTITGRRRRLPEIRSADGGKRGHAEREAVNTGIQGPCSDFNLVAATIIDYEVRKRGWKSRIIALVHDAIYMDCPAKEVLQVAELLKEVQERVPSQFGMVAPLRVERRANVTMGK